MLRLKHGGIVTLVIRTELFDYARALGVMIAYTIAPVMRTSAFRLVKFDAVKMAEEIMVGVATTGEKEIARLEAEARAFVLSTEELNDD